MRSSSFLDPGAIDLTVGKSTADSPFTKELAGQARDSEVLLAGSKGKRGAPIILTGYRAHDR